ncbi:telomere zinc finger-associated protein-like [Battus philenor]|uniref:telomere zinc finger-associated protein-like n=1 Tax=Battus philenor TaxID=42288 RepID=UPI0035CF78EB
MSTTVMKVELESETCVLCGAIGDLLSPEEHDAGAPPLQVPLRSMLLQLNNNKVIREGRLCSECIRRAIEAYEFSTALSTSGTPPLSEKIRALRRKLHELTQKIDVFIVVGGPGVNSGGTYSEDDIIMVERDALAAAAAADDEDLEQARNACGDTVYQCSVCPLSFQRASEYREHIAQHPSSSRHSCWTCGAQFATRAALTDHSVMHTAPDFPGSACRLCHTSFQSATDLRHHEANCEARCPLCRIRCASRSALSAHAQASHSTVPPLLCGACFRSFDTRELLAAHRLRHRHADRFVCGYDACILRFATRNDLLSHIRKCHGGSGANESEAETETQAQTQPAQNPQPDRTNSTACPHCPRTFGSVAAMKRHIRVHRNDRHTQQDGIEWQVDMEEADDVDGGGEVEYLEMDALDDMDYGDDDMGKH